MKTEELSEALRFRLDEIPVPAGDLESIERRGAHIRRVRRLTTAVGLAAVAAVVAVVAGVVSLWPGGDLAERRDVAHDYVALGPLDLTDGLRAYAFPGAEIHIAGRTFEPGQVTYLDTDATATPYGIVFFDQAQRPHLLGGDGKVVALADAVPVMDQGWHPTAKADAKKPWVAWSQRTTAGVRIVVYDLAARFAKYSWDLDCSPGCDRVRVEGIDSGQVLVQTAKGPVAWKVGKGETVELGAGVVVADARARVLLYDETRAAPSRLPDRWRAVPGAIDSQLSFDGRYVLSWSSTLSPTHEGLEPITLAAAPPAGSYAFWSFDTDGSVLVALPQQGNRSRMYDCVIGGPCADLGDLVTESGDPIFIGADM